LQIYAHCAEELRMNAEGAFHVDKDAVDEYCSGPCLDETKLALQCVEEVAAESFRFSNGASLLAVRQALGTGCGYGPERGTASAETTNSVLVQFLIYVGRPWLVAGTFEIRERKECVGAGDHEYYHHGDHEQMKPTAGRRYYGEGGDEWGQGEGHGEEYCYGNAGGRLGWRSGFVLMLVASAALLLEKEI
jgi:hypothetical protein